jgi:hypothetical protein
LGIDGQTLTRKKSKADVGVVVVSSVGILDPHLLGDHRSDPEHQPKQTRSMANSKE